MEVEVRGLHNQTKNLEVVLEAEVSNLQAQVMGEEKIKDAFKEFKKFEDDKVEQRCAEMDARLDKLSMSEGLKHGIEHGKADQDLAVVEAYDLEADSKDPWAFKEEMLLEDAIAANIIRAEKEEEVQDSLSHPWDWFRSSCQIRRYPCIRAYHRSPGLAILLKDAAIQTEEDEPCPRLQRSISLPPFYNLEWK
ncbi:hypothetical protein Tco_1262911 [Tanacetum coccineum]